jgi:hypothetical protein
MTVRICRGIKAACLTTFALAQTDEIPCISGHAAGMHKAGIADFPNDDIKA